MKNLIGFWAAWLIIATASVGLSDEYVRRYVRGDETYVAAYWRSSPDDNPYNNFSSPDNVNPYTSKVVPGNPDTYLQPYYNPKSDDSNPYGENQYRSLDDSYQK